MQFQKMTQITETGQLQMELDRLIVLARSSEKVASGNDVSNTDLSFKLTLNHRMVEIGLGTLGPEFPRALKDYPSSAHDEIRDYLTSRGLKPNV